MSAEENAVALTGLVDREKIRDRLARLSRGLDRRDPDLIRASYWPGATDDQGVATCSVDELIGWVVPGDTAMVLTLHTLGQSIIDLDGDTALVETHVTAYHRVRADGSERDIVLCGRYVDRLHKRGDEARHASEAVVRLAQRSRPFCRLVAGPLRRTVHVGALRWRRTRRSQRVVLRVDAPAIG